MIDYNGIPDVPTKRPVMENDKTLRDWFAGQALMGLMSLDIHANGEPLRYDTRAKIAYKQADAMMKAREES